LFGVWIQGPVRGNSENAILTALQPYRRPQKQYWYAELITVTKCQDWEIRSFAQQKKFSDADLDKLGVVRI